MSGGWGVLAKAARVITTGKGVETLSAGDQDRTIKAGRAHHQQGADLGRIVTTRNKVSVVPNLANEADLASILPMAELLAGGLFAYRPRLAATWSWKY